jgi:hypothetical protein
MKSIHLLIISLLSLSLILQVKGASPTLSQIIWMKHNTDVGLRSNNYNFYFLIRSKIYHGVNNSNNDSESENSDDYAHLISDNLSDFRIKVIRNNAQTYQQNSVKINKEASDTNIETDYHFYRFFLPEIDGTHKAQLANVVWDIKVECGCYVSYKIRYFNCDSKAEEYYNNLHNTVAVVRREGAIRTSITVSSDVKIVGLPFGQFANGSEVLRALYDVLPCVNEKGGLANEECCLDYSCWLNMTSPQCICSLDYTIVSLNKKPGSYCIAYLPTS